MGINIVLNGSTAGPPGAGTTAQQPRIAGGAGELQPELWELGVYPAEWSLRPGLGSLWDPVPAQREHASLQPRMVARVWQDAATGPVEPPSPDTPLSVHYM